MNGKRLVMDMVNLTVAMYSHADIIQMTSAVFLVMMEVNVLVLKKKEKIILCLRYI
jgi:hypothetical protein